MTPKQNRIYQEILETANEETRQYLVENADSAWRFIGDYIDGGIEAVEEKIGLYLHLAQGVKEGKIKPAGYYLIG